MLPFVILLATELTKTLLTAGAALLGGSFAAAVVTFLANRRKVTAETVKLGSEAASIGDAAIIKRLNVLDGLVGDLQEEQVELRAEVKKLKKAVNSYREALRLVIEWRRHKVVANHLKEIEALHPFPEILLQEDELE